MVCLAVRARLDASSRISTKSGRILFKKEPAADKGSERTVHTHMKCSKTGQKGKGRGMQLNPVRGAWPLAAAAAVAVRQLAHRARPRRWSWARASQPCRSLSSVGP